MKKRILGLVADLAMAVLVVLAVWIVNYKIPQGGIKAVTSPRMEVGKDSGRDIVQAQENQSEAQSEGQTEIQADSRIATDVVMDTQDWHEKFADIYVGDITCFQTAFAQDTYGVVYRNEQTGMETCVLNWDGTMDIYRPDQIDIQRLIEKGAYQSWVFGPSLLDENGKAKDSFLTWSYIRQSHPRTAVGYYEPGHYCLLVVDGRQKSSRGMFLNEMAKCRN